MIVLDASVLYPFIVCLPAGTVVGRLLEEGELLAAPHLVDAEVGHTIRSHVLRGLLSFDAGTAAIEDTRSFPIKRYPHGPMLARAFELRDNATIYDALYLALAEALDARLLTLDRALTRVPGVRAEVQQLVA